jgi:hypothetical protein
MSFIINIFCALFGIAFIIAGIYLGLHDMLIGGIIEIIESVKMTPIDSHSLTIGIVKAIFFEMPIGIGFIFGFACFSATRKT